MKKTVYHWYLLCEDCGDVFQPVEENWDEDVSCPHCGSSGPICSEEDHGHSTTDGETTDSQDEYSIPLGAHPDWPSNLSDDQLDRVWSLSGLLTDDQRVCLELEYELRERQLPPGPGGDS